MALTDPRPVRLPYTDPLQPLVDATSLDPAPTLFLGRAGHILGANPSGAELVAAGLWAELAQPVNQAILATGFRSSRAVPCRLHLRKTDEGGADRQRATMRSLTLAGDTRVLVLRLDPQEERKDFTHLTQSLSDLHAELARHSYERNALHQILQAVQEGIMVTDETGAIVLNNPALEAITGPVAHLSDVFAGTDLAQETPDQIRAFAEAEGGRLRRKLTHPDGHQITCAFSVARADTVDGIKTVFVIRDISDRERLQAAVLAAEEAEAREQAKMRFLRLVSHELRTPLNGVTAAVELLGQFPISDPEMRRLITIASDAGALAVDQINRILDFSRLQSMTELRHPHSLRLDQLCHRVVDRLSDGAKQKGNQVTMRFDGPVTQPVLSDPQLLTGIVTNLVSNAIKFTQYGQINLHLTMTPVGPKEVQVRLRVKDTGVGFDTRQKERLLSEFELDNFRYDRPQDGSGLGLAIVASSLRLLRGEIDLQSEIGRGSVITVTFPLALAPVEAAIPGERLPQSAGHDRKLRVIVADDQMINRDVLRLMLERLGCVVTTAENGREAVEAVEQGQIDAVFMDVSMPEMDGITATAQIRAHHSPKDLPIFGVTAHSDGETHDRCRAAGMNEVVCKPIRLAEIKELLARVHQDALSAVH